MQYTITVNQFAFRKHFPLLNISHAAIVDWFSRFTHSSKISRLEYEGKTYYWLQYDKAREELPILGITNKDSMRRLIKAICNENILEAHPDNQAMGRSYFAFGDRYDLTHTSSNDLVPQSTGVGEKNQGSYRKERGGRTEKNEGVVPKCTTDPYIHDHNSNDQREKDNAHKNLDLNPENLDQPITPTLLTQNSLTTTKASTGSAAIVQTYSALQSPAVQGFHHHQPVDTQAWLDAYNENAPTKWSRLSIGFMMAPSTVQAIRGYIAGCTSQDEALSYFRGALAYLRVCPDTWWRDRAIQPATIFNPDKLPLAQFFRPAEDSNVNAAAVAASGLTDQEIKERSAMERVLKERADRLREANEYRARIGAPLLESL